jgi:hypothetical protein
MEGGTRCERRRLFGAFDVEDGLRQTGVEAAAAAIAADQVRRPVRGAEERRSSVAKIGFAGL